MTASEPIIKRDDPLPSLAFIGCGAVGRCLGRRLREEGYPIAAVCCRTEASAARACAFIGGGTPLGAGETAGASGSASLILIATPDREIPHAAAAVAGGVAEGVVVLHCSGALSSDVLQPCRSKGAAVGSMHPLQSFPDPETALRVLEGSIFACEGDGAAVAEAFRLAERIGGVPIRIETSSKAVYHAAAAAASNFMIVPLLLALDLMEAAGIGREQGLKALIPLIEGTLKNACAVGIPEALTGPIERGDASVLKGHLESMDRICPELKPKYRSLALMTVEAARRKGALTAGQEREILRILDQGS